jgi:hypothetical protein
MNAVRKDLFESGSKVMTSTAGVIAAALCREGEGVRLESDRLALRKRGLEASLFSSGLYLRGLVENRGLCALPHEEIDGVGDAGMAMLSGMGLGGIGDGSCQRCKFVGEKKLCNQDKMSDPERQIVCTWGNHGDFLRC